MNTKFPGIGVQLRAIRERLGMTLDVVSKKVGISRSYVSEFERGLKLPTAKYLMYLHEIHNISLNYIFGCDEEMYCPTEEERKNKPDFGYNTPDVMEMLRLMSELPHARFSMLSAFSEYKIKNKQLIDQHHQEKRQTNAAKN